MRSQKKAFLAWKFRSSGIFVTLHALCNLMYLVYCLYALHYIPYAHTILHTRPLSTHLAMLHTKMQCNDQ